MKRERYRFLQRWRDKAGREYAYFRRGGRRTPLPGTVGSDEFRLAYTAALSGDSRRHDRKQKRDRGTPFIGVYLLMLHGRLDYIGSSMHMPQRVEEHRRNGRPFDQAFYIPTTADDRLPLERTLIRQLNPHQNQRRRQGFHYEGTQVCNRI